jgi:hypothetical protein
MKLFVAIYPYALIKEARALGRLKGGADEELALLEHELAHMQESKWPVYRTIAELARFYPDATLVQDASGSIAQSRSRMAGRFLASDCDVQLSIDDDIFARGYVLERLLAFAADPRLCSVVTVPYILRDGKTPSVSFPQELTDYAGRVKTTGMGLVASNRATISRIAAFSRMTYTCTDDRGLVYPTLFLETIEKDKWLGEDISFCRRVEQADVTIEALYESPICHAGRWSKLTRAHEFVALAGDPDTMRGAAE